MNEPKTCKHCGHAILARSHANAKYCSRECSNMAKGKAHARAQELRYAAPKPIARTFTVGQRVHVPFKEMRTIGGQSVEITGTAIGTVSEVGDMVTVNVTTDGRSLTHQFTPDQLRGAAVPVVVHQFGYPTPAGGGQ
jgi:hypothetical protein